MGLLDKLIGKKQTSTDKVVDLIKSVAVEVTETSTAPETPKVKRPRKPKADGVKTAKKPARKKKVEEAKPENPDKLAATEAKEPWVNIISIELQEDNVGNGAIELDWNDYFIARLVKAGYMRDKSDTDSVIVDRWFQDVCRNIVLETYEQYDANFVTQRRVVGREDLGDGKTIVS